MKLLIMVCAALALVAACGGRAEPREIIVMAASDLTPAFEELGREFERQKGVRVRFSFGSTGNLARQIGNGAPVDLFAAANVSFVDELERKGFVVPGTKALYARGRLTLYTAADSRHTFSKLEDLARPEVERFAIANPEHAPYGVAAREALEKLGLWERLKDKCVFGEDVRTAQQFAETGNVDVAVVALSLSVRGKGRWVLVPEELHRPLEQALAVVKGGRNEQDARAFAAYVNGPEGRPVMKKYGFVLPGETP
ncbi:MAG TPA: molybdate ABC transporter substrate-binding protein [Pyrinomonadaceae bacterium]|nr:molybdate ABC transporter substrate-binding protein [Pyrinomonadaceae bacterium]